MEKKGKKLRNQNRHRGGKGRKGRVQFLEIEDLENKAKNLEEDILKLIFESKEKKIDVLEIERFSKKSNGNLEKVLKDLKKKKLIKLVNSMCFLTPMGSEIAGEILKKHKEIEEFIKNKTNSCDAHEMAHVLEHSLSEESIKTMYLMSSFKGKGTPLCDFSLPSGTIVDISWNSCNLMTKLISIGIFPGQRIHILNASGNNYLLNVKNSKIAIGRKLASGIMLIP